MHLASEIAFELGHRAAVRSKLRQLRLVRRPNELHQLHRLRSDEERLRRRNPPNSGNGGPRCTSSAKTSSLPRTASIGRSCCTLSVSPTSKCRNFLVHGWWNISGAKMSKSLGNVIDPDVLADKYGAEALRYYLMSDMVTGNDADFSEERLVSAIQQRSWQLARKPSESHDQHG